MPSWRNTRVKSKAQDLVSAVLYYSRLLELCSDPSDSIQGMNIYYWGESGLGYQTLFHFTEFVMVRLDCANLKNNCHCLCHSGKMRDEQQKADFPNYLKKIRLKPGIRWFFYPIQSVKWKENCRKCCPSRLTVEYPVEYPVHKENFCEQTACLLTDPQRVLKSLKANVREDETAKCLHLTDIRKSAVV